MTQKGLRPLIVDNRWQGQHGIARYSTEVLKRLTVPHSELRSKLSPTSPFDAISPSRWGFQKGSVLYSPGFNVGLCSSKQVITVHDLIHLHDEAERSPLKKLYYDYFVKPAIIKAGRVFTVSETSVHQIREWLSHDNIRVINTSCGISPEFMSTGAKDSRAEGAFLYVGSIKPHKNLDILFKALSGNSSFKLVLVTSDISAAQQLVVEYNVQDQVTILSSLSDSELSALYRAAQALLMPSTLEGFGLPAAEAIACGTPVLHWDGCESVKEIVGEYGSCLPSATDVDQWSEAMQSIYSGNKQSVNPSAAWRNTYSWDSVGQIVNQELTTLLAESALS